MSFSKPLLFLILSLLIFLPLNNLLAADVCSEKYDCKLVNENWQCGSTGISSSDKDICQKACLCDRSGTDRKGPYKQCATNNTSGAAECIKPGLVPCGNSGQPDCTICDIFVLAQNIINFILIDIVPVGAALMATIAGLMYLFGGAVPKWRDLGKKLIKQVVYGLIIIYISFIILNTVLALVAPESRKYFSVTEGGVKIQCLYPK